MLFYLNMYRNKNGCCKLTLKEETQYADCLKLLMYLSYEKDGKTIETRLPNDHYPIPTSVIKKLCIDDNIDTSDFILQFFNIYVNSDMRFKLNNNISGSSIITIIDGIKITVFKNIHEMKKFKEAIFTYYNRYLNNRNNVNNRNEPITDKPEQSPVVNENSEIDENINNIINDCPHMEVPLFKSGTVVLVRDIDTYNKIAGEFKYPEIGPCLGTMETLCSENKRYYVVGIFNDSLTTFVHELTHLAFHIYRDTSMKVNVGEGNETYAYLVDSFFQEWQHLFTNRCD